MKHVLIKILNDTVVATTTISFLVPGMIAMESERTAASVVELAGSTFADPVCHIYAAIPPESDDKTDAIILEAIEKLGMELPGSVITVIDGIDQHTITEFTAPSKGATRVKLRELKASLKPVVSSMSNPSTGQHELENAINLPAVLYSIGTSAYGSEKDTRLVAYGSLYYVNPNEPHASFRPGEVPSPGHPLASSRQSIYGTSDLHGLLDGIAVDIVTLGEQVGALEQRAVVDHWSWMISEMGGSLTSVAPHPGVSNTLIVNRVTKPVPTTAIDRSDTVMEIRKVRVTPPVPVPAPVVISDSAPVPVIPPEPFVPAPTSSTVDLVWVIDGSASMSNAHKLARELIPYLIELGAGMTPGFRVGFVVYRGPGDMSIMNLTPMNPPIDGQPSYGTIAVHNFFDGSGQSAGQGGLSSHPPFARWGGAVDPESGIAEAVRMLERGTGDRKIMLILGDVGPIELDGSTVVSEGDKLACQSTVKFLKRFVESQDDARVVTVFTGQPLATDDSTKVSLAFFEEMADLAGDHGEATTELDALEPIITRAMLAD